MCCAFSEVRTGFAKYYLDFMRLQGVKSMLYFANPLVTVSSYAV